MIGALAGLARAYARRLVCVLRGHVPAPEVPAPPGYVTCARCKSRYPLDGEQT